MRRRLAIFLLTFPLPLSAQQTLRVERAGAPPVVARVSHERGYAALPASVLEAAGARLSKEGGRLRATLGSDTMVFETRSPFFRVGSRVLQLADPVYRSRGEFYLPRQLVVDWLPARQPRLVRYADGVLTVAGRRGQAAEGKAATARAAREAPATPRAARTAQARGGTASHSAAEGAARSTARSGAVAEARGRATAAVPTATTVPPDTAAPERRIVILDAGHGGRDPGKIGPDGIREKDVTLSIAKRLGALLSARGYEVHLTRATDTLIALADRPRLANEWKEGRPAAIYISIHANSGPSGALGYETYFLSEARTADERRVAEMENSAERFESDDGPAAQPALDHILNNLRNDFYMRASDELAEAIQRRLSGFHPGPDRGVKQAGFRVLVGAFMPAVLVETAFISDRSEERLLARAQFQEKLAYGIAQAVDAFFAGHAYLWAGEGAR